MDLTLITSPSSQFFSSYFLIDYIYSLSGLGFLFLLLWVCLFCSQESIATIHSPSFFHDSFSHFIFSGRFVTFVGVGHLVLTSAVCTHSIVISWHWTLPCRNLTSAWYFPSYRWLTFFLLRGLQIPSLSLNFSYLSRCMSVFTALSLWGKQQ